MGSATGFIARRGSLAGRIGRTLLVCGLLVPAAVMLGQPPQGSAAPAAQYPNDAKSARPPKERALIVFWSASRPYVAAWVHSAPPTSTIRLDRLRAMFTQDGCDPEQQNVGKDEVNLICTLHGESEETIVLAAHYEYGGNDAAALEDWSGPAMLPLLLHSLQATPRHFTYIFAALDGEKGAKAYFKSRKGARREEIRAFFDLDDLGISPTRSCSFPDNSIRSLRDIALEQVLIGVAQGLGAKGMPQRQNCNDILRVDDTESFRSAGIPSLVIHSVPPETRGLPGSQQDTAASINPASYYNTYQVLATYLCVLDRNLDQLIVPGAYDPRRDSLAQDSALDRPVYDQPAESTSAERKSSPAGAKRAPIVTVKEIPLPAAVVPSPGDKSPGMVTLDVVATGKDGAPATGLSRDEFQVLEGGQPQQIAAFEGHTAKNTPAIPAPGSADYLTNAPPALNSTVVVVLDSLNTDWLNKPETDANPERRAMLPFLKNMPPGAHIAVMGLESRLRLIQGLNGDSSTLLSQVQTILDWSNEGKENKDSSAEPADTPAAAMRAALTELAVEPRLPCARSAAGTTAPPAKWGDTGQDVPTPLRLCPYDYDSRARTTSESFQQLGRYLDGIPGRKSVAWLSNSFPLPLTPEMLENAVHALSATDPGRALDYAASMMRVANQLGDAQASLYPIDANGSPGTGPPRVSYDMKSLAEATGGAPFSEGEAREAMAQATLNGLHYYTLSYQPTNPVPDGSFRNIQVKVRNGQYKLAYRRGYFSLPGSAPDTTALNDSPGTLSAAFAAALWPGLPPSTQMVFNARATRAPGQPDDVSVRYIVDFATRAESLFAENSGTKATLLFAVAVNDAPDRQLPSRQLQASSRPLDLDLSPKGRARLAADGIRFQMEIDAPLGTETLTLGIYDPLSQRMGTLDVPIANENASQ